MTHPTDAPGADDRSGAPTDEPPDRSDTQRDVDLAGRDLIALGRMAAAGGDAGAARAFLAGAVGSEDSAVAGEAANLIGAADSLSESASPRLPRRRRLARDTRL